jgi:predicted RNase H-like HicB family nuclease
MKKVLHFNLIFKLEPEGGFTVVVPSLPGCVTYGKNLKEAKIMAQDAIEGYLFSLKKHNELIPSDSDYFVGSIDVESQWANKLAYA